MAKRAFLGSRFDDAVHYATIVHAGQVRKGTRVPYMAHLLDVAALVLDDGGDEDEAIAALLHDAAEDHGGKARLGDIENRFGGRVACIVADCSDTLESPKPPWGRRKSDYLARLRDRMDDPDADRGFLRVTLADKLSNARSIQVAVAQRGDKAFARFSVPKAHTLAYYNEVSRTLRRRHPSFGRLGPMAKELRTIVKELGGGGYRLVWVERD